VPSLDGAEPYAHDGGAVGALLLHGFTGSPLSMRPWADTLAAAGLTVRLPLLAGHATRWQDLADTRFEDWYADAAAGLDQLRARCSVVVVMGLSMGGTLALALAERRPDDVDGLVLVNASVLSENKAMPLLPVLSRVLPSLPGIGNDIAKPGTNEGCYDRMPLRALASLRTAWSRVRADLGSVDQPLLLMRSATDHVVEPSNAAFILGHVASQDVTEVVLERSYHVATLDYDAPTIFSASAAFAERLAAAHAEG